MRRELRAPDQSWLELFYDLVFVAAILVLSAAYSKDTSSTQLVWLTLVFGMVWCTWLATTVLTNRVRLVGTALRAVLVLQMVGVLALVLTADSHLQDSTRWTGPVFAFVLVAVAVLYRMIRHAHPDLQLAFRHRSARLLTVALAFAVSPLIDSDWWALVWLLGLIVVITPSREQAEIDEHHMVHRFGELTIVILGETFVKIGLVATEEPLRDLDLWVLPMAFVLVFAIWWLYFTDVPASGLPSTRRGRFGWTLLHLPLHMAVVVLAVGVAKLLTAHAEVTEGHAPGGVRFLSLPLLLVGLSLVGLNLLAGTPENRRRAVIHVWSCLAIVVVVGVGFRLSHLPPEVIAVALTLVMVSTAVATRRFALPVDGDPDASTGGKADTGGSGANPAVAGP